jgi:hypothetical protein
MVADTNPNANAIVGMWFRHFNPGSSGFSSKESVVFNKDGSCLRRIQMYVDGVPQRSEQDHAKHLAGQTWSYQGGGVWHWNIPGYQPNVMHLAEGKLLMSHQKVGGVFAGDLVYSRVVD